MIDPDLKMQLDAMNENLTAIKKKSGGGVWRAFFKGMFNALGYIAGLALVAVILVWFLQRTGQWQAFTDQVQSFTSLVDSAKNLIPSSQKSSAPSSGQPSAGTPTIVTLPNGQQIKLNLPAGY